MLWPWKAPPHVNDGRQQVTRIVGEFSRFAQSLAAAPDENTRLQLAVDSAVALVASCDHAGITINERGGLITRVSSDDLVRRANELQHELGEGPCLDVRRDQNTFVTTDLAADQRWPRWAPRVHDELGVGSMMSLLVFTDRHSFGALSLYARHGHEFDADDVAVGQAVAGHLSVAVVADRQLDQLGLGLANRNMIGQAQGILMERLDITAEQAFDFLRRASMGLNRKVVDVAADIARSRTLPELP
jgi:GAF domain-containing protein